MGVREEINKRPALGLGAAALLLAVGATAIGFQFRGPSEEESRTLRMFVSTDDGQTCRPHPSRDIPPFTLDGREAVAARVYQDKAGKRFVGYLIKYTPDAKQKIEKWQKERGPAVSNAMLPVADVGEGGTLYKRPGDTKWVTVLDPAAGKVLSVRAPDGSVPQAVDP